MRANDAVLGALAAARRENLAADGMAAPVPGAWGITRRRVLQALGGLGAAAALPAAARTRRSPGRVAILGGGIAGLTALHLLREAGVDARLYEARKRLGGRVHTVEHGGVAYERGAQLVNSEHADIHRLCRTFGIALVDRKAAPHRSVVLHRRQAIDSGELARQLRPIARQIDADAALLSRDFARYAPQFDRLSMRDYLDRHAALIGAPWVRALLEGTARTEYGAEADRTSAIGLLFNLPVVDGERVEVLGGSDERFVIAGGSSALVDALGARHRDHIQDGHEAIRVAHGAGGAIDVTFRDLTRVSADHVIIAVPASRGRFIDFGVRLPAAWRAFLAEMELGRNEKWQWAMAATPWRASLGAGGEAWSTDADGPAALAWEATVHGRGNGTPVWNWFFGGDQTGDMPGTRTTLAEAFAGVAPQLDTARVADGGSDRSFWGRDPLAGGAYVNYRPGQLTRFASLMWIEPEGRARPPVSSGRVIFAGEHLSDAYPGYMNGAAQTGRLAAETIVGHPLV